jgi:hypothetical protein
LPDVARAATPLPDLAHAATPSPDLARAPAAVQSCMRACPSGVHHVRALSARSAWPYGFLCLQSVSSASDCLQIKGRRCGSESRSYRMCSCCRGGESSSHL